MSKRRQPLVLCFVLATVALLQGPGSLEAATQADEAIPAVEKMARTEEMPPSEDELLDKAFLEIATSCSAHSREVVLLRADMSAMGCSKEVATDRLFDKIISELEQLRETPCEQHSCGSGYSCQLALSFADTRALEADMQYARVRIPGCPNRVGWQANISLFRVPPPPPPPPLTTNTFGHVHSHLPPDSLPPVDPEDPHRYGRRIATFCRCVPDLL